MIYIPAHGSHGHLQTLNSGITCTIMVSHEPNKIITKIKIN